MVKTVLVSGGSGLVGSRIAEILKNNYTVLAPSHKKLDITDKNAVFSYIKKHKPDVIIHAAALIDLNVAERERGDKESKYWRVNVEGTKYVTQAAKSIGSYLIYISTGSVFRGSAKDPGPYPENHLVTPLRNNSWYGWTKSRAEQYVKGAVLRVAHPIKKSGIRVANDYVHATPVLYRRGKLYPMFTDQRIQLTWIDDIAKAIEKLIRKPKQGIFHVTNPDWVTPYDLSQYIINDKSIQKGSIDSLMRSSDIPLRFHKHNTLDVKKTQKMLGIRFKTWKQAVDLALTV